MPWLRANHLGTAVLALIAANIIWGAAPPIFKWALQDISPFTLGFLRFLIAAIVLLPFVYKELRVEKKDIGKLFMMGFVGVGTNIIFFFFGLQYAPSINASIIGSAGPIFLILSSMFFLKERPRHKLIVGALVGLLGVLFIMLKPLISEEPNLNLLGNLFFFLALFGGLLHTIIGRELIKKYGPKALSFWCFFLATLAFLPFFVFERISTPVINATLPAITGVLFGALLCSLIAYFFFFWALKYMQAAETSIFVYIDPIVTVMIAFPLLGEKPDLFYFIGAIFVFLGIYIAEGRLHYHPIHLLRRG